MALSPRNALDAVNNLIGGARNLESGRLARIADALQPRYDVPPAVQLPRDATPTMKALAVKARTNLLPLVLDTFSQGLKVEGYSSPESPANVDAWAHWQRNGMDAHQTGVHRSTLAYGAAYATVLPGDTGPVIEGHSPRQMTAVYQRPNRDEWPMLALLVDGNMFTLYDETSAYYFGAKSQQRSGLGQEIWTPGTGGLEFIERRDHDLGVCPVVRFRDRMLLEGEEQFGIIEPLIAIQERIDETTFGLLIAQFYAAFKQRWVIGWVPKTEAEEMKASAADFWNFEDPDVKVGQFEETDLTRYLKSKDAAFADMAAIAQVPAQSLGTQGVSNISAETLAAMEAGKDRKNDEIQTSMGESWEQVLRMCSRIAGDDAGANDFSSQVRWKNTTARSLAQTVDALIKMVQGLDVPAELARQMIPGWNDQLEAEAKRIGPAADSFADLTAVLNRRSSANPV